MIQDSNKEKYYFVLHPLSHEPPIHDAHRYAIRTWTRKTASRKRPKGAIPFSQMADKFWIIKREEVYGEAVSTWQLASLLDNNVAFDVLEGPFDSEDLAEAHVDAMWGEP